MLAFVVDLHLKTLPEWQEAVQKISKCEFNTVVIRNLFDFKDKSLKPSLVNKFSLKLSGK